MGWFYHYGEAGASRRALIQELIKPEDDIRKDGTSVSYRTLKSCFRGRTVGVLWSVVEVSRTPPGGETRTERFIRCDLLRHNQGRWGHKPLQESSHPYFYSCPGSYLDMVPPACEEWRTLVREWNARQSQKRAARRAARKART